MTHVLSGPIGCAWAGHFAWQKRGGSFKQGEKIFAPRCTGMCHLIDCVLPVQPALDPPPAWRRVDHRRVGAAARARLGGGRRGRLPPCRCSIVHHIKPRNTSISKGITSSLLWHCRLGRLRQPRRRRRLRLALVRGFCTLLPPRRWRFPRSDVV